MCFLDPDPEDMRAKCLQKVEMCEIVHFPLIFLHYSSITHNCGRRGKPYIKDNYLVNSPLYNVALALFKNILP